MKSLCSAFVCLMMVVLCAGTSSAVAKTLIPEGKPFHLSEASHKNAEKLPKIKAGWVEKACVGDVDFSFYAKLDTGAKTTSANAEIIKEFKRDGKEYILYRLVNDEKKSEAFESEITRYARIKLRGKEEFIRRPYVLMNIKIGKYTIVGEVNLTNRGQFNYPLLIGRNMLADYFYVDSGSKNLLKTQCPK